MDEALDADQLIWRADGVLLMRMACLEPWVRWWQSRVPDADRAPRARAWSNP